MLRVIPFSLFIIVPAGELLLPFALKIFPNLMPSTFNEAYSNRAQVRKFKAKQEFARHFQAVVEERTKMEMDDLSTARFLSSEEKL